MTEATADTGPVEAGQEGPAALTDLIAPMPRPAAPNVETVISYWEHFQLSTFARLQLSYMPMHDFLERAKVKYRDAASVAAGSCSHEVTLALLKPDVFVHCFDVTDSYLPGYTKEVLAELHRMHFWNHALPDPLPRRFDLVLSIQTLEHLEDPESALDSLCAAVRPGGHLYLDVPLFHEEPSWEKNFDQHKRRAWEVHEHHSLGFSRRRLEARLEERGFQTLLSGYYSYHGADQSVMSFVRDSDLGRRPVDAKAAEALNRALSVTLWEAERRHSAVRDALDRLLVEDQLCKAVRILARRRPASERI